MIAGHHYYRINEKGKDSLSKEGALNLCSLFKVWPQADEPHETYHEDGHYTVRARVHLLSLRSGQIVATGDGSCSTRESKYSYRWEWSSRVPSYLDKEKLPTRKVGQNQTTQYRVDNEDLADQYNTVLKMAVKRATVAAVCNMPLVSELFTQDLEDQIDDHTQNVTRGRDQAPEAKQGNGKQSQGANSKPETPLDKLKGEINASVNTLFTMGHAAFIGDQKEIGTRILEHVRSVSLDRDWPYQKINKLSDLSEEHLGVYAGILEGEIAALKEERANAEDPLP
jgi:hypothetical protein